jgi:hypothetical protein
MPIRSVDTLARRRRCDDRPSLPIAQHDLDDVIAGHEKLKFPIVPGFTIS